VGDFRLGLGLFAMAAGSVLALPVAGWFVGRCGSHVATGAAGLALCLLLPAPVAAPNLPLLMLALLLFGAANGLLDVSMNAQAVSIEDRYPQPILSSLHGLYSTGGLAGASVAAWAASVGISASAQAVGVTAIVVPLLLAASRFLLHGREGEKGAVLAWPSRALMALGALAFLALLAEGAMGDGAAVFLREYWGAGMDGAATGFAGFSLAMALGRFSGDRARRRWGGRGLLRVGGLTAGLGMAVALVGAAGRARGVTTGLGIGAVATAGYAGLLTGPPMIGVTAELVGLGPALVMILFGVLVVAAFAGLVRDTPSGATPSRDREESWAFPQ